MKIVLYFLLIAGCCSAHGQDYCKRIKKEVSEDKKSINYSSPFDAMEPASIHVTRNVNLDPDYPSDNFYIIFRITGDLESIYAKNDAGMQSEKDEKKIVVEFDDKSTIVDDSMQVSHDFTDDKLQAIRYVYYPLSEQSIKEFTSKKVSKYTLAGFEQKVVSDTAVSIQHYVTCIKDAK
jgi:hypothetical protein